MTVLKMEGLDQEEVREVYEALGVLFRGKDWVTCAAAMGHKIAGILATYADTDEEVEEFLGAFSFDVTEATATYRAQLQANALMGKPAGNA